MIDKKLEVYKKSLKRPYTGMTKELRNKIDGIEVKEDEVDMDLNDDGVVDKKDASIAGKVLRNSRKKRKEGDK